MDLSAVFNICPFFSLPEQLKHTDLPIKSTCARAQPHWTRVVIPGDETGFIVLAVGGREKKKSFSLINSSPHNRHIRLCTDKAAIIWSLKGQRLWDFKGYGCSLHFQAEATHHNWHLTVTLETVWAHFLPAVWRIFQNVSYLFLCDSCLSVWSGTWRWHWERPEH